jgi:hypothetical protein
MYSSIENIIVTGTVEECRLHILGLSGLGKNDCVRFLALDVGVQVDDLDTDFEVVEKCHNLNLVCLLVDLLHFRLAKELDGQLVFNEGLIKHRIILEFT